MTMLVVWAAVLLTYGVSAGNAMETTGAVAGPSSTLQLDMAPNSVDDMYVGCREEMSKDVTEYLKDERNNKLIAGWDSAAALYNKNLQNQKPFLGREWITALYAYTSEEEKMYLDFNNAVRSQGSQYKKFSFGFGRHALHFLLTDAIQALNAHSKDKGCLNVYRRVSRYFDQEENTQVRFGSFTSSSLGQYSSGYLFGDKSCFEIVTCMGAEISKYSTFPDEREVLIPPYEVFTVDSIKQRSLEHPDLPCEVVYTLRSTKMSLSNLNCALFPK